MNDTVVANNSCPSITTIPVNGSEALKTEATNSPTVSAVSASTTPVNVIAAIKVNGDFVPDKLTTPDYGQNNSLVDPIRRRIVPEFTADDLNYISEIGRGNGGIISKLQHKHKAFCLARKTFELVDMSATSRAQIVRELQVLYDCASPYIVEFHGAFHVDSVINVYMECMDIGGLDRLLPMVGRFPEPIIVLIADSVVRGLHYLWEHWHIIHRNMKPSNILINRSGAVKISDFVVSQQLSNNLSSVFIGLCTYLAPEQLTGEPFNSASDVWSFGLTLMELAIGRYPIPAIDPVDFVRVFAPDRESNLFEHWRAARTGETLSALTGAITPSISSNSGSGSAAPPSLTGELFGLFATIVEQSAPRLPAYCFSSAFICFIHSCLQKDPNDRSTVEFLHNHTLPSLIESMNMLKLDYDKRSKPDEALPLVDYLNNMLANQQSDALTAVHLAVRDVVESDADYSES